MTTYDQQKAADSSFTESPGEHKDEKSPGEHKEEEDTQKHRSVSSLLTQMDLELSCCGNIDNVWNQVGLQEIDQVLARNSLHNLDRVSDETASITELSSRKHRLNQHSYRTAASNDSLLGPLSGGSLLIGCLIIEYGFTT